MFTRGANNSGFNGELEHRTSMKAGTVLVFNFLKAILF
jgi:hypothetical protein